MSVHYSSGNEGKPKRKLPPLGQASDERLVSSRKNKPTYKKPTRKEPSKLKVGPTHRASMDSCSAKDWSELMNKNNPNGRWISLTRAWKKA